MEFHFAPGQHYDCVQCAKGCLDRLEVGVDPYSQRVVKESFLALRVIEEHGVEPFTVSPEGRNIVTKIDHKCVFLNQDNLCEIHAQLGIEAKPLICRIFPYSITPTPDGYFIGISHYCTSAKLNNGRPLSAHQGEIEEILKGIKFTGMGFEPLALGSNVSIDWEAFKALEASLSADHEKLGWKQAIARGMTLVADLIFAGKLVTPEDLQRHQAHRDRVSQAEVIQSTLFFSAFAVVAFLSATENHKAQEITERLMAGQEFTFEEWGFSGSASEVFEAANKVELGEMVERYFRGLLFCKQLGKGRPVFHNLVLLYLLPDWLCFYAGLHSLVRGAAAPEKVDMEMALDLVEREIVTHGRNLDALLLMTGNSVLEQLSLFSPEEVDTGGVSH
ncbi:MAG: YkgJ family cysteine cluster protein [Vulcanimicrobiota bacterium]